MVEQELLDAYKQYDYLNADINHPIVKVLVSYIKPSFLFKSAILTPIHLGKAVEHSVSKDGVVDGSDLRWLHENCSFNDDFKGGISSVNRRLGFFTGTYWAWNNYEQLGCPEYFGSFGYRKLLHPSCLNELQNFDLILPRKEKASPSIKDFLAALHGQQCIDAMLDTVSTIYKNELPRVEKYINQQYGCFHELYIARKQIFFDYCSWIYPVIKQLLRLDLGIGHDKMAHTIEDLYFLNIGERRDVAYIVERLTGYYVDKISNSSAKINYVDKAVYIGHADRVKFRNIFLRSLREKLRLDNSR